MNLSPEQLAAVRICQSKESFTTRFGAITVIKARMKRGKSPLTVYECAICHQFHLTGRENVSKKKRKNP